MITMLETEMSDGRVIITFPGEDVTPAAREEFISFLKSEWALRQSAFTEEDAAALALEVDSGWWASRKERLLERIGTA